MRERSYPTILLVGILACVSIFGLLSIQQSKEAQQEYITEFSIKAEKKANTFLDIPLEASSVYILDVSDNEALFEKDAYITRGIASITKLMTFAVTWPKIKDLDEITISENSVQTEGYSPLIPGSNWTPEDLLSLMLISSSNDAAEAIKDSLINQLGSESAVIITLNEYAKSIGMNNTIFKNVTGLDETDRVSNISTAFEVTLLAKSIIDKYPEVLEATARLKLSLPEKDIIVENTNPVIDQIPNIILSKTGYTDRAGGNLVIAYKSPTNDHIVIITVLGSSHEGRFRDTLTLVNRVEEYFKQIPNLE